VLCFLFAMTATSFVFDEDDPEPPAQSQSSPSFLLPSGELNFDAYVAASPSVGQTGGGMMIMVLRLYQCWKRCKVVMISITSIVLV
jgi:hypothetical protein